MFFYFILLTHTFSIEADLILGGRDSNNAFHNIETEVPIDSLSTCHLYSQQMENSLTRLFHDIYSTIHSSTSHKTDDLHNSFTS